MASIARDKNGTKRVCFTDAAGVRRSIRLGSVSVKAAESMRLRVESLLADRAIRRPHDAELATWLAELPAKTHEKLVRAGLAEEREAARTVTLGALLAAFFTAADVKPSSLIRMRQAETALVEHFGADRDARTIGEGDAEAWRTVLRDAGYAPATIGRTVRYARQVFRWGIRRGLATVNPFAGIKAGPQSNPARAAFIDRETIAKVIDAAPDAEWRLLIALSRFGGLRVPSEALALRWCDVDWANARMMVRSPKTEHHEGRGERMVPIFPELREHLQAAFDAAPVGAVFVIDRYREGANLNPHFRRIIRRAGVTPWDRAWHNLRASRQTELAANHPLHVVCAWIGNTRAVAAGHYLQVTDADWTRATGGEPEAPPALTGERKSGAQCGAPAAQKAAKDATAPACVRPADDAGNACFPSETPPDASERNPAAFVTSGPYWT